jgi:hypothetical protein
MVPFGAVRALLFARWTPEIREGEVVEESHDSQDEFDPRRRRLRNEFSRGEDADGCAEHRIRDAEEKR